MDNKGTALTGP